MKTLTPSQSEENKTPAKTKLVVAVATVTLLGLSGFAIWKVLAPKPQNTPGRAHATEVATKTPEPVKIPLTAPAATSAIQVQPQPQEEITPPILAIPRDQAGAGGVPRGFGFEQPNTFNEPTLPDPDQAVNLQKPTAAAPPVEPAKQDPNTVGTMDPRVVGSSRVDLQACKLEYSIVSPK